jgi:hypothetical protein
MEDAIIPDAGTSNSCQQSALGRLPIGRRLEPECWQHLSCQFSFYRTRRPSVRGSPEELKADRQEIPIVCGL